MNALRATDTLRAVPGAQDLESLIVVGSGAAGMMAACVAGEAVSTTLVTDRGLGTSNSAVAQGGLQLPEASEQSMESFRRDMERSGGPTVSPERIARFAAAARPTIFQLIDWGLELDRDDQGVPLRRLAGGLSEPRIVTSGDRIGTAVLKVLRSRLQSLDVKILTGTSVVDVERSGDGLVLSTDSRAELGARAVVLAVGGRAFEHAQEHGAPTSNPPNRNSRLSTAVRALGVEEIDPQLFQYQPYGLVDPVRGVLRHCVPESVVELGARVVDAEGEPIAPATADRRELTEAMFARLADDSAERSPHGEAVCRLTLGSVDQELLLERYPHLQRTLDGLRLANGDVHVVPVVHYQLGGFSVDGDCGTAVPGLYLAGEMTGGLHGRNRLMGNGITQAVVDGHLAGEAALRYLRGLMAEPG